MNTATFSACVEIGETFDAEEPRTGPAASIGAKPAAGVATYDSGFWGSAPRQAASARRNTPRALPRSTPPARPVQPQPRKVAVVSEAMAKVFELLDPLARADLTITLIGETGTGKDVLARTIHQKSSRADGPFVVFDCGAVAQNLAESELLGHERGSFTGAHAVHAGAFERADGGTLFLDEVGELPLDLQTRLLRVLGNRKVRRVGGTQDRPVDVRIVAATNRDLQSEVSAGRFRQDLYFRLAAAVIQVPPLRQRSEDIPVLVTRLLEDLGRPDVEVTDAALETLVSRPWPGNVRELKNALACAVAFLDTPVLEPRHLSFPTLAEHKCEVEQLPLGGLKLERIEREAIAQTLRQTLGNKARAAEILGIAPSTLYEKLKKYQRASVG